MNQTIQIFVIILSLLILPTNAYGRTIEYEHGYKAALNDTLGLPIGFTSSLRSKPVVLYNVRSHIKKMEEHDFDSYASSSCLA